MADTRIIGIARTVTSPNGSEYVETDHATDGSGKLDIGAWLAARRNALAPSGGIALDGTNNARAWATLTGQNFGTDDFSISVKFRVPTSNPTGAYGAWIASVGPSLSDLLSGSGVAGFGILIDTSGNLSVGVQDNSTFSYRNVGSFVSTYGGVEVHLVVVRSGSSNPLVYINGVLVATTAGAGGGLSYGTSINSAYLMLGLRGTSYANNSNYVGVIRCFTPYNFALSASDVLEIFFLGGAVPERLKWGSQAEVIANSQDRDFSSAGTGNWNNIFGGASAANTSNAFDLTLGSSGQSGARLSGTSSYTLANPGSSLYRVSATLTLLSGTNPVSLYLSVGGGPNSTNIQGLTGTPTSFTSDILLNTTSLTKGMALTNGGGLTLYTNNANGAVIRMDNVSMKFLGAVAHYDSEAGGLGYQWHDAGSNKLDLTLAVAGVTWPKPQRRSFVRGTLSWSGTHEGKSLLGQRDMPDGAVVTLITRKSTAASTGSGCTIGTSNSATRWAALAAMAANTKAVATLANQLPAGTADNDCDTVVDPDTANFTGSVTIEKHYSLTEGT